MIVAFIHQNLPLSSLLLLRNPPHTFAFIPILLMCLSSPNRSIYAVFLHIMPYSAHLCKVLHYSKTGVPWQMKSTFIIVLILLVLPRNALPRLLSRSRQSQNARLCKDIGTLRVFCKGFWGFCEMLLNYRLWQIRAEPCKLLLPVSSKISSKRERVTTKGFSIYQKAVL